MLHHSSHSSSFIVYSTYAAKNFLRQTERYKNCITVLFLIYKSYTS